VTNYLNYYEGHPQFFYNIWKYLITNVSGFIDTENFNSTFYDSLNEFDPWSFLLEESTKLEDSRNPIHSLYFVVSDEELYKSNDDDPDFVPRFNKTIYDYIRSIYRRVTFCGNFRKFRHSTGD